MQIVRVRNIGNTTFKDKYDSESYTIPAGSESLCPFGAMILWAGNPDARNVDARQMNRQAEVNRMRVRWGAYENDAKFAANSPKLEFYTMDADRIWTVLDDPEGEHSNPSLADEHSNSTMSSQLAAVQAQMKQVTDMIASGKLVLADGGGAGDVSTLDQMGADSTEQAIGLTTDPSALTPLPEPGAEPVIIGGPPLGDDDGSATVVVDPPVDATAEDGTDESVPPSDGPPTDTPKSVKIGGKSPTK